MLAAGLLTLSAILPATAADPKDEARKSTPPPPRLERLEQGEAPAINIPSKPTEQQIQDERDGGRVKSTRVRVGGSEYRVVPNDPKGSAQPGDLQSTSNRPAQWQVMEFNNDPRKGKDAKAGEGSSTSAPANAPTSAAPAAPAAPAR